MHGFRQANNPGCKQNESAGAMQMVVCKWEIFVSGSVQATELQNRSLQALLMLHSVFGMQK